MEEIFNGWSRTIQVVMTVLAGAAFLSLIIMQHDVSQLLDNQSVAVERVVGYIEGIEVRSEQRHRNLLEICITMEERMCDRLCDEQSPVR